MKYSEAIKPISYFKAHIAQVIRQLNEDQGMMIITQNGEARAVVIDIRQYERMQETLAMLELIAQGEQAKAEGRYRPIQDAFKEMDARYGVKEKVGTDR